MQVHSEIALLRTALRPRRGEPVVLVPTMGALHDGHERLVEAARARAGADGTVVVSLFVNPTQFGPKEDFAIYPRTPAADAAVCARAGADFIFAPDVRQMYHADASIRIDEGMLSRHLCGASRPGHFSGVCTVVAKLFNIVQPDIAVFGKKDRQQLAVIRRLARDLDFPIEIAGIATARAADGLALSSRNRHLDAEQRQQAPLLYEALQMAATACAAGCSDASGLIALASAHLARATTARIDYLSVVDAETMQPVARILRPAVLAAAVFFGATRLIDNIDLVPPPQAP